MMPDIDITECLLDFAKWMTSKEDGEIEITFTCRKENGKLTAYYNNPEKVAALLIFLADDPLLFELVHRAMVKRLSELDYASRKSMLVNIYERSIEAPTNNPNLVATEIKTNNSIRS